MYLLLLWSSNMTILESFSARQNDEGHFLTAAVNKDTEEFFGHARTQLRELSDAVVSDVIPTLEERPGKWHPVGGFMVYHLGVNTDGESLRLHIWPEGERKKSKVGPHIHNHAWQLSSLVLAGTYMDTIYGIEPAGIVDDENERRDRGLLRAFSLGYLPDGTDAMLTDGTCFFVKPINNRVVDAGEIHNIKDGVYHLPKIPDDKTVATLVLDSPSLGYNTTVFIDASANPIQEARHKITPSEARRAAKLLLA